MRGQHRARLAAKAHISRRPAADGGAQFAFGDQTERLKSRQPIGDNGAAEIAGALDVEPCRRLAGSDQPEDGRETRAAALQQARTADAPFAAAGGVRFDAGHRNLGSKFGPASQNLAASTIFPQ